MKKYSESEKILFVSDTHFGHSNILKYCNRPFDNVQQMDECLIEFWNKTVSPNDVVYHLGDFAFKNGSEIYPKLNGYKILIKGNHDGNCDYFDEVYDQLIIQIGKDLIYLNHFPFLCYAGAYRENVYQLYGHVHSGPKSSGLDSDRLKMCFHNQYDVGVDNNMYRPIEWQTIKDICKHSIPDKVYYED